MSLRGVLVSAAVFFVAACVTGQVMAGDASAPPSGIAMPQVYQRACVPCHARGGFGAQVLADRLGPERAILHDGTRLPEAAIRAVVRNGMGHMPAMSRIEITDAELDAIAAYLVRGER